MRNTRRFVKASTLGRRRSIKASYSGTAYDYLGEMVADIKDNFDDYDFDYEDRDDLSEQMHDTLWAEDSITGNGSGSYFFDREKARDAIRGNEDLLIEAIKEFGDRPEDYKKALTDPEWADVTIRCYMLGQAIDRALDEMGIR